MHLYGVGYIVGILFAWWYAKRLVTNARLWPNGTVPMKPEDLDDFIVWAALGVVLGGRAGYVLFYDLPRYIAQPSISLPSGRRHVVPWRRLGVVLAMTLFSWSRGIRTWSLFDVVAAGVPVGLGLVRMTNFINSELWGRPTDVPWRSIPRWRAICSPSEPALRGAARRPGAVPGPALPHPFQAQAETPRFVGGAFIAGYGLSASLSNSSASPTSSSATSSAPAG